MHQPNRIRPYSVFDIGESHDYFSQKGPSSNEEIFHKVANKSYYPMVVLLSRLARENNNFSVNLSISGIFIEQCEAWEPNLFNELKELVATGKVELATETYFHSLAFFYNQKEFENQLELHNETLKRHFGVTPKVLRNTELAYNNEFGKWAAAHGYKAVLAEGWDPILNWRSSHYLYSPKGVENVALFLKDYRFSDDIAFRFSNRHWSEWPLTPDKYRGWIDSLPEEERLINLFMDFETFGEHQWTDTGIFDFFERFVRKWCDDGNRFATFTEVIDTHRIHDEVDMPDTVTWADTERDLSAWLGNAMQQEIAEALYSQGPAVLRTNDDKLIHDWRLLQSSDHLYYLSTKWYDDGNVHAYFSPYDSPYDAFLGYMNAVRDIRYRVFEKSNRGLSIDD
ncbi:alpha-amylase [Candidatus Saccharibacteria bacterium]|nr:alpha-amylase [Candidatus Saccharibacteria bacterium]